MWLEKTGQGMCLRGKTRWGYLVIRNLSPSVGCGAFAQHHRHCLGKHRWGLLRNLESQRGSQHSWTTAACSSPPGGQSSEGRRGLQHMRCAQPTKYKQPSSPRSALLWFTLRLRRQKFRISFWTMFCIPTSCSFSCTRERVKVDKHVLFAVIKTWNVKELGGDRTLVKLVHFCLTRYL